MVYCPHCGSANTDSATICRLCGLRISSHRPTQNIIPPKQNHNRSVLGNNQSPENEEESTNEKIKYGFHKLINAILWILFCPIMLTRKLKRQKASFWYHLLSIPAYLIYIFYWLAFLSAIFG